MPCYYRPGERLIHDDGSVTAHFAPEPHAQGAWNPHEQHMAPATGVICSELECFRPRDDLRIGRVALDILGLIPLAPFTITTRLLRPGRTIELVEATMSAQGRACIVARAWRMQTSDTSDIAGTEDAAIAGPEPMQPWDGMDQWSGGYIQSLHFRADARRRAGSGIVWMRNDLDMVEGRETSAFVRLMGMVDTANGIVTRASPREWAFPNLDLNIDLLRLPEGPWLGLQTTQDYGSDGIGLTRSVLHDLRGPFGHGTQILTLRRMG